MLHRAAFLYVDDGLVASTDLVWLQGLFDTLDRLFNRVGLCKNVGKLISVLCSH